MRTVTWPWTTLSSNIVGEVPLWNTLAKISTELTWDILRSRLPRRMFVLAGWRRR